MPRIVGVRTGLLQFAFLVLAARAASAQVLVFQDGFASGSNCVWSQANPESAQAIGLGTTSGETVTGSNGLAASCLQPGAPERVYLYTAASSGFLNLILQPTLNVDLGFSVRTSCAPGGEIVCVDDNMGGTAEIGQASIVAGSTYVLIVDGVAPGESGPFDLTLSVCGDGLVQAPEVCDGPDLNGQSCQTQGFPGGVLFCQANCQNFDISACIP